MSDIDITTARHSLSHILAAAVQEVCPGVKLGIGPAIEEGFYYDFLLPEGATFSPDVVEQVGSRMRAFLQNEYPYERAHISLEQARRSFSSEPFKLDLISEFEKRGEKEVSTYRSGPFLDLCNGPHVAGTRNLRSVAWKIDRVAGAYWRGDSKNPMLQRIYVLAFPTRAELDDYLKRRELAAQRDHRKLGAELELFTFSDLIGKGLPILLPKGATMRRVLERFAIDEEIRRGYQHVITPHLGRRKLYEISGHWAHYKDGMYPPMDVGGDEIVLRPMTCPHHFQVYADKPRSYHDLPMRIAEVASQFRRELSGELSGLVRVMFFNLADAHIMCTPDQLADEFKRVVELIIYMMQCLGLSSVISYRASLRDDNNEKYVDNPAMWEKGQGILLRIIEEMGLPYRKSPGDAAFYGPKLDVQMRNVMNKEETLFTVQIDFCMPERFDMTYVDEHGNKARPVVIHRSSIGCLERTTAFLIEHYGGAFPLWFAPVQVRILTITDKQVRYAKEVETALQQAGLRVETDLRNETINKKLREARLQRIPYLLIIGEKEAGAKSVTVRNRETGHQQVMPVGEFVSAAAAEVSNFALTLGIAGSGSL
jgi:threonyl-tRNA synthetase